MDNESYRWSISEDDLFTFGPDVIDDIIDIIKSVLPVLPAEQVLNWPECTTFTPGTSDGEAVTVIVAALPGSGGQAKSGKLTVFKQCSKKE